MNDDVISRLLLKFYYIKDVNGSLFSNSYNFELNGNFFQLCILDDLSLFFSLLPYIDRLAECPFYIIIPNVYGNVVSFFENRYFILICFMGRNLVENIIKQILNPIKINNLSCTFWNFLWKRKVDYYESIYYSKLINVDFFKDTFFYFLGLAENAICYFEYNVDFEQLRTAPRYLCHKKISLCNSFIISNFIVDYRSRDIAEILKLIFVYKKNIEFDFREILHQLNYWESVLLYARIIFPTFYFDCIDDFLDNEILNLEIFNEDFFDNYEMFLNNISRIINDYFSIPEILWIKKRTL